MTWGELRKTMMRQREKKPEADWVTAIIALDRFVPYGAWEEDARGVWILGDGVIVDVKDKRARVYFGCRVAGLSVGR